LLIERLQDITTVTQGLIGHCVNCRGAMGSGVAKSLYTKWPIVRQQYLLNGCGEHLLGSCDTFFVTSDVMVSNVYGQLDFGHDGKRYGVVDAFDCGLKKMFEHASFYCIQQIYLPKYMGCVRAGLDWDSEVFPIINKLAQHNQNIDVTICEYNGDII
jgi:hypothetical protein